MKNLEKVAERLKRAAKEGERVILFGDSDLDGITSVMMVKETIEFLGGATPSVYISDREKWGYGLSKEAVCSINENPPALIISLDCGISNFEGAKEAKRRGFELVIVDHHKTFPELPEASLILDPMQEGDEYPFKKMANGGIVYKLSEKMLGKDFSKTERRFLELATLATLADMVPRKEDNQRILEKGMGFLKDSSIFPLKVLKEVIGEDSFLEKMISLLNITSPYGNVNSAYLLLEAKEKSEAEKWIEKIKKENEERREEIKREEEKIVGEVSNEEMIIFKEGSFSAPLAGTLASRVIRKCKKPVFLYTKESGIARGSARVPSGQDAVDAMRHCKRYLQTFGGHPEAAGFILREENVNDFKKCLLEYFKDQEEESCRGEAS